MDSLAHAIHRFQSGDLSHHELLAQVDRILATDKAGSARLLEVLGEESNRMLLPDDVYSELHRRVVHLMERERRLSDEETRVQANSGSHSNSQRDSSSAHGSDGQPVAELDRMKGVGDTLNGRFVLEECIGFGGMGTVYKALDLRKLEASDRKPYIAIKVLNVQFRGHPKSLIALQREARKAQALAHPNIVAVYDFDRDGSMVYLTMEYLTGKPLSKSLQMRDFSGMPFAGAMHIVSGIAKALAYAHERGFVHCDLKPANVFLTDKSEVKVIDFGIARVFQKTEEDAEATVFDAGSLGGLTPAYASPEMLENRMPDPRDDIYALACITYELLTGRHPFNRLAATQARNAGLKPQRPMNLGHKQWRALRAALSFDRETRTPTVTRFLQEMSGERPAAEYVALVTSSLLIGVLLAAALGYYWESRNGRAAEQAVSGGSSANRPPTAPPAAPSMPALSVASITPILARVPCSALAASVHEHALQVQGYLHKGFGAAQLKNMLSAVPGVKTLNVDVQQVSDDKCALISAFGPYWAGHRQAGGGASIHTRQPNTQLTEGDALILDITSPGFDSYVNVDYYDLQGGVTHMLPNPRAKDNQAPPNYSATIGSFGNWVVAKPFGTELIVLLATPVPLFDGLRPEHEPKAIYLQALEKQLGQIAGRYGAERIAVDFVQITTKSRKPSK